MSNDTEVTWEHGGERQVAWNQSAPGPAPYPLGDLWRAPNPLCASGFLCLQQGKVGPTSEGCEGNEGACTCEPFPSTLASPVLGVLQGGVC